MAVRIVPQPDDQVSFQVDGQERLRWHACPRFSRPFFFPVLGPAGRSLSRMGHPAAPDHDHHKSLWWGHQNVNGVNLWEEHGGSQQVRQEAWIHYQDGDDEAIMAVRIGWFDAHRTKLVQQELIAAYRPLPGNEALLELQTTFMPTLEKLPLGRTNFGFLGLRVARELSAHYGRGQLRSSSGATGEKALFAQPARWMDYSGPIVADTWEGITWFDHPTNPRHPTPWHVRDDGWMSAAFCLREGFELTRAAPLRLRYGFHVHAHEVEPAVAEARFKQFAATQPWELAPAERPWRFQLRRRRG